MSNRTPTQTFTVPMAEPVAVSLGVQWFLSTLRARLEAKGFHLTAGTKELKAPARLVIGTAPVDNDVAKMEPMAFWNCVKDTGLRAKNALSVQGAWHAEWSLKLPSLRAADHLPSGEEQIVDPLGILLEPCASSMFALTDGRPYKYVEEAEVLITLLPHRLSNRWGPTVQWLLVRDDVAGSRWKQERYGIAAALDALLWSGKAKLAEAHPEERPGMADGLEAERERLLEQRDAMASVCPPPVYRLLEVGA